MNTFYKNCFAFAGDRRKPECLILKKIECQNCKFFKTKEEIKNTERKKDERKNQANYRPA